MLKALNNYNSYLAFILENQAHINHSQSALK